MSRMHLATRSIVVLGAAIVIAGCGGGDDAMVDPGASATPAPDPGAATVGDPNAPAPAIDPATGQPIDPAGGAIDPATGLPMDPAAGGDIGSMDISETIPTLEGHKVKGGLAAVGSTPLFAPGAVKADELAQQEGGGDDGPEVGPKLDAPITDAPVDAKPKVTYSGARVFVDGVSHEVSVNGTFPKGDPVFRLVSVTGTSIEIELVAGEFTTSGGTGVFLDKGETVSVFNQSEQLNYRVKYLRPVTSTSDIGFN